MKSIFALASRLVSWVKTLASKFTLSEKILFYLFTFISIGSLVYGIWSINNSYLEPIPKHAGSLKEGFIGTPRFVNPILAVSDTDKDLSSLVYSGLMRAGSENGSNIAFIPDLAEGYTVSEDGLTYTFTLKPNLKFHDGKPLTTEDIAFTIDKIQDPAIKSPKRVLWDGVSVKVIDASKIEFTLKAPYSAFIANTTVGILPKHIWNEISDEEIPFSSINIEPIGSGPYKVNKISKNSQGLVEAINLSSFKSFALGIPYIKSIEATFFPNEKTRLTALSKGNIDSAGGISDENASILKKDGYFMKESSSSRLFALFLNQNKSPALAHKEIRKALSESIDKKVVVNTILNGFGSPLEGPLSPFTLSNFDSIGGEATDTPVKSNDEILADLAKSGWKKDENGILSKKSKSGTETVSFNIYTSDNEELKETAELLKKSWEPLGIKVEVKSFESSQFSQTVIRPREYDSLLFGVTIGRDLDYYSFWHSSQRNDPGLNVALYTNSKADTLLTSARTLLDPKARLEALRSFALEVLADNPAVFLYSPSYIYITPKNLGGYNESNLRIAGERFYDVYKWYVETDSVWKFLSNR